MSTREEIEAAVARKLDDYAAFAREYRVYDVMEAVQNQSQIDDGILSQAYLAERAERQRRIETAAEAIEAARAELDCVASPEARKAAIVRIITSHLDGETP